MRTSRALTLGALALALPLAGLVAFSIATARRVERALPPRGRFINVDGTDMHVVERGAGPPLLLIHGLAANSGTFSYALIDRLADAFSVVAIDRPGAGYSGRAPNGSANFRAQAATIAKAIGVLKLDRPIVVGHSLGGAVALALAIDHPELVRALALIAPLTQPQEAIPAMFRPLAIPSPIVRLLVAYTLAVPSAVLDRGSVLATVFAPDPVPADYGTAANGLLGVRPVAFLRASEDLVAAPHDLDAMVVQYDRLRMPVAILFGRDDAVLDPEVHGRGFERQMPNARLTLVAGGHMLPISDPKATAAWLRAFATEVVRG